MIIFSIAILPFINVDVSVQARVIFNRTLKAGCFCSIPGQNYLYIDP